MDVSAALVAHPQFLAMLSRVIRPIGVSAAGGLGPTTGPTLTAHRRHGVHQGQSAWGGRHIVAIGAGQDGRQQRSLGVGEHVMLAPRLAPVRRMGTGLFPHRPRPAPTRCPRKPATSPAGPRRAIWTTAFHGAFPTLPPAANPAADASRSSPNRIPSPGAVRHRRIHLPEFVAYQRFRHRVRPLPSVDTVATCHNGADLPQD